MPQDFQTILAAHAARYPEMAPQDYVKLAYQSEFGPAHLLPKGEECLQALQAEWAALPRDAAPVPPEDIGGGLCRLHLEGLAEEALPLVAALFRLTAEAQRGSREGLEEKLSLLEGLPVPGMGALLEEYRRLGGERVSFGSDAHRAADIGRGAAVYRDYLRALGFDHLTVFRGRKAEAYPL